MNEQADARALTTSDAAAQGISRRMLPGNFARVVHGVHVHKSVELSVAVRCAAAQLVLPIDAVFSHLTAVELLGLPLPFDVRQDRPLDVTMCPPAGRPRGEGIRGYRREVHADEVRVVGNVWVTTAPRTFIDLATTLDEANLIVLGDAILRQRLATLANLEAAIRNADGRRGVARARHAVTRLDARSASPPESLIRVRIEDAGLPRPALNVDVFDNCGGWIACPDLLYEEPRIAIEYEGDRHREKRQFGLDVARDQLLMLEGFAIVRAGPRDLPAHATTLPDTLRRLLRERAPWMLGH